MSDSDDRFEEALRAFANVLRADATAQPAAPAAPTAAQPPATPAAATPAPAAPEIPASPLVPAAVAAAQQAAGPQPPPGKAPLTSIDEWEALPEREQMDRMDEVNDLLRKGEK
jgi:hypothetical protein